MNLHDARILVTGGASGLGLEMASNLSSQGARVAILDLDARNLEQCVAEFPEIRGRNCDVSDPHAVDTCVHELAGELGGVDVVINNAGILHSEPLLGVSSDGLEPHAIAAWRRVISVNLDAVFYVTRAVAQLMVRDRTKGLILNISSVAAAGNAGQSAYSAAKAGVEALTVTWAKELGPWGIRVVAIAPGFMDSDSSSAAMTPPRLREVASQSTLGRLGHPSEIAHAARFAIENDFLTGTTLRLDGGLRI